MKMKTPLISSLSVFVDCIGTRASLRARGEMVPEVHGVEKELDPHMKPEQKYPSKGATPKKTVKTPKQGSTFREGLRSKIDPVRVTPSQVTTDREWKKSDSMCQ